VKRGLVILANMLTVVGLVLAPVVVACLLAGGTTWRVAAFVAFGTASVTDLLDGRIARSRGLITDFGKIADPIADKALTGAALVTLSYLGWLPWWVTIVILAREVAVTALRFWVIRYGVIAASRGGELKTLLQGPASSLYKLPGDPQWLRAAGGGSRGDGRRGTGHRGHRRRLRDTGRTAAPPAGLRRPGPPGALTLLGRAAVHGCAVGLNVRPGPPGTVTQPATPWRTPARP